MVEATGHDPAVATPTSGRPSPLIPPPHHRHGPARVVQHLDAARLRRRHLTVTPATDRHVASSPDRVL